MNFKFILKKLSSYQSIEVALPKWQSALHKYSVNLKKKKSNK